MRKIMIGLLTALILTSCNGRTENGAMTDESVNHTGESAVQTSASEASGENGLAKPSEPETAAESDNQTLAAKRVMVQLYWDKGRLLLPDILELLEEENARYYGVYNVSGERIDIALEGGENLVFLDTKDMDGNSMGYELMMAGNRFNSNGFQENYLNQYDVTIGEEYYPDTGSKVLEISEIGIMNETDLSIARNEIYARHGREFKDTFLSAVFQEKTWYRPVYEADEFAKIEDEVLNSYEKKNLELLIKAEMDSGYRLPNGASYQKTDRLLSGSWVDLDGDGKKEQVKYQVDAEDNYSPGIYEVSAGKDRVSKEGMSLFSQIYIASLDGKTKQLLAAQSGDSADFTMDVYLYKGGKLSFAGLMRGDPGSMEISGGEIYTYAQFDHFQTRNAKLQYELKDGTVREVPREFYEHGNEAEARAEIMLYTQKDSDSLGPAIKPGDQVIIVGGDNKEWILIEKKSSGERGWLRCVEPYYCILPDGTQTEANQLFDGLTYWG